MSENNINKLILEHQVSMIEYGSELNVNGDIIIKNTIYIYDKERNVYIQIYYKNDKFNFYKEYKSIPNKEHLVQRMEYVSHIIDKLKI